MVTDLRRLSQGTLTRYRESKVRCEACAAPVASDAMLRRIAVLLGSGDAATFRGRPRSEVGDDAGVSCQNAGFGLMKG